MSKALTASWSDVWLLDGVRTPFVDYTGALAQISHASVVSVLNFFRENETVYMVMNYLEGATLQDFIITARDLKTQKVFRESTIRSLFDEVLRGLRIVHQHKMLHLDIKPANIFITDDNKAVMIDFGAAREVLSKEGNFIRPMYTPGFAAPAARPAWSAAAAPRPAAEAVRKRHRRSILLHSFMDRTIHRGVVRRFRRFAQIRRRGV